MWKTSLVVLAVAAVRGESGRQPLSVICAEPTLPSQCPDIVHGALAGMVCTNGDGTQCGLCGFAQGTPKACATSGVGVPAPSSDPTKTFYLLDGETVWTDLGSSEISYVPDFAHGLVTTVSRSRLSAGHTLGFQCSKSQLSTGEVFDGCYMLAFQFRCPGCTFENGGLPSLLLGSGWDSAPCAPRFRLSAGGPEYPMVTFVKAVEKGDVLDIPLAAATEFVMQTGFRAPYLCEHKMSAAACASTPGYPGYCYWNSAKGECKLNLCFRNQGPWKGTHQCEHCPSDELALMALMAEATTGRR